MKKILIVEDDINLGTTLSGALEAQGYEVHYLTGSEKVAQEMHTFHPDIVLLDVMLNEKLDGFDLGRQIRSLGNVPVLFTTSCDSNEDFEAGFSIGNSDYVRKPYRLMEVLLRIEKMLAGQSLKEFFQLGDFCFHPNEQSLRCQCDDIHLNNLESSVLTLLCQKPGMYINKKDIIQSVWNEPDHKLKEASLNNIISNLRKHLQKDSRVSLETKIGLGIKLALN